MSTESADDINVGVSLSTALLLPSDLERNAGYNEYENYALMLQHSVQAEATIKAQQMAEEKVESAEAIKKVAEAEKKDAEVKKAQAEKELEQALATKNAEITEADEKAYAQGMTDVTEEYKLQVKQSEAEDEDKDDGDALVRKPKHADEIQSLPQDDQILHLTHEEDEEVIKEATPEQASSDFPPAEKNLDETLAEIDAEIEAEKIAEEVPPESSKVPAPPTVNAEES
ncbi:methyl-CpG-binding domain-containing protein 10-like [Camellia sinensis]|uniref:methyl-CpG-binding domain-containing protein 10-like n=1 Tax=Camellia sinensis TaxID=4442 RepID=UPI0010368B84|nr:methyl-CpG-binding domain-containing protein 10-like [Camellia sinensis]